MVITKAFVSPSLLSKQGISTPIVTIDGIIKLRYLDDVRMVHDDYGDPREMIDQYVVTYDKSIDKFILAPAKGGGSTDFPISEFPGKPGDTIYYTFTPGVKWKATDNLYNDSINIGILNTSPEEPLHVGGNIKLKGSIIIDNSNIPSHINIDEINLYLESSSYTGYENIIYNKKVVLSAKNEKNQDVIVASVLKYE